MRALSLFSGIGGFDLAAEWTGFEVAGFVELDPFCQKVLRKHWPHVKLIEDIHNVKGDEFGPIDIIYGGFPCQPFSVAGLQRGEEDDRYLWPQTMAVIAAIRPRWCLLENVTGIIKLALDTVLADLEAEGYTCGVCVLPACAKNAPHRRDRVWIVAHAENCGNRGITGKVCQEDGRQDGGVRIGAEDANSHAPDTDSDRTGKRHYSNSIGQNEGTVREGGDCQNTKNEGGDTDNSNRNVTDTYGSGDRTPRSGADSNGQEKDEGWRELTQFEPSRQGWQEPWLEAATRLCRVDARVSGRVDRLKSLGNAIVPQIAYEIMKAIEVQQR